MTEETPWIWVDEPEAFDDAAREILAAKSLAVDTESDSMHSYFEKVCLLQIATQDRAFLLDTLSLPGRIEVLAPAFADPEVRLVLHGADYDIVCLKRDFGFEFRNVFDTMIAAQCLDLERIGLADLVAEEFGATLDKRHSRTNWARRPLSPDELLYSYLDVKYLTELAAILETRLTDGNVREEAEVEFRRLEEREHTPREFDPDGYTKIRGSRDLGDAPLAILRELYLMRDRHAQRIDRPPFKVIANDTMLRISRAAPRNEAELSRIKGASRFVLRRYGDSILRAVARGRERGRPPAPQRRKPRSKRLSPRQQRQMERLKDWRKLRAAKRGVPTLVVLPNHAILEVVTTGPSNLESLALLTTVGEKRARLHGGDILRILNGG